MNQGQQYRAGVLVNVPPMTENRVWRAVDPRDRHRIQCDRVGMCGQDAIWATQAGNIYVCDYHRYLLDIQRIVETMAVQIPDQTAA